MIKKNFEEYKKEKTMKSSYEKAKSIQEGIALSTCISGNDQSSLRPYEGHISVMDILGKIDTMVRMFERSMKDDKEHESCRKIHDIIVNLYDLAQIKMTESKNQTSEYMRKATGVPYPDETEEQLPADTEMPSNSFRKDSEYRKDSE